MAVVAGEQPVVVAQAHQKLEQVDLVVAEMVAIMQLCQSMEQTVLVAVAVVRKLVLVVKVVRASSLLGM